MSASGHTVWVFGTIHVPDPRVLDLPPVVADAFDEAGQVITEIPLDGGTQADIESTLLLPEGQRLSDLIGNARFTRLQQVVRASLDTRAPRVAPIVLGMLDRLTPFAVMAQLATLEYVPDLLEGRLSLDARLYADAKAAGKHVSGLETAAEQVGVFDAFSMAEQVALLDGALGEREAPAAGVTGPALVDLYLRGDAIALADVMRSVRGSDESLARKFEHHVLLVRNRRMAERIAVVRRADRDGTIFVAVGALHLVGAGSVLDELTRLGYAISRVRP